MAPLLHVFMEYQMCGPTIFSILRQQYQGHVGMKGYWTKGIVWLVKSAEKNTKYIITKKIPYTRVLASYPCFVGDVHSMVHI